MAEKALLEELEALVVLHELENVVRERNRPVDDTSPRTAHRSRLR
ncbi:MAG TPA: hypothetical protein VNC41_07160 [Acidimicrobiia bacterium]|nr:hypothetical protein [Acidimicrobiia bacterium]